MSDRSGLPTWDELVLRNELKRSAARKQEEAKRIAALPSAMSGKKPLLGQEETPARPASPAPLPGFNMPVMPSVAAAGSSISAPKPGDSIAPLPQDEGFKFSLNPIKQAGNVKHNLQTFGKLAQANPVGRAYSEYVGGALTPSLHIGGLAASGLTGGGAGLKDAGKIIDTLAPNKGLAYDIGKGAGDAAHYYAAGQLLGGIPAVAKIGGAGLAGRLGLGRFVDLPMDIINAKAETDNTADFLKHLAMNQALGLAFDGGLEAVGAGVRAGLKKLGTPKSGSVKWYNAQMDAAAKNITPAPRPIPQANAPQLRTLKPLPTPTETPALKPKGMEAMQNAVQAGAPLQRVLGASTDTPNSAGYGKNTVGAAEGEFPNKQKTSKVFSNTYQNSDMFTQAEKNVSALLLNDSDIKYDVIGEQQSLKEAAERLAHDFAGEVETLPNKAYFDGVDTDTAMGILEQRLKEARETGNYDEVLRWSKIIREKGTEAGQRIQAFSKYSRTPENLVVQAQRVVQEAEDVISAPMDKNGHYPKGAKPQVWDTVKREAEQAIDTIKSAEGEAAEGATREVLSPAERLAKKVESTTKLPTAKDNAVNDMVNELFRSAKESPLPERLASQRNPVDFLRQAIQDKDTFANTWTEAKAILRDRYQGNPEIMGMLNDYFDKGIIPTYSDTTLERSIQRAGREFGFNLSMPSGKKIQPQKLNDLIKSSRGDKGAALKKVTDYLIEQTGASGDDAALLASKTLEKYNQILSQRSEAALKNMFRELPKVGQKTTYQRVMELINMGAYDNDSILDIIKQRNKIPVLNNEDVKSILEFMDSAVKLPEGSRERLILEAKAVQVMANKRPVSLNDKFLTVLYDNMLGNFRTLISRNAGGNLMFAIPEAIREVPTAAIDKLVSLRTGQRTRTMPSKAKLKAYGEGLKKGAADQLSDYKHNVNTPMSGFELDIDTINRRMFEKNIFNDVDRLVRTGLSLGDRPFYEATYAKRMVELNKIREMGKLGRDFNGKNFDEVASLLAKVDALEATFQNKGKAPDGFQGIKKGIGDVVEDILGFDPLSHPAMPFTRTLGNLMARGVEYSPAGIVKNIIGTAREVGGKRFNQRRFVDETGRNIVGGLAAAATIGAVEAGNIVGELSSDEKERAAQRQAGMKPYSVKIGDTWHTYDWIPGIGTAIAATADGYQAVKDGKGLIGVPGAMLKASVNSIIEQQPMAQGLKRMFGYGDTVSGAGRTILEGSGQLIPSLSRQVANTLDPAVRETYDPNIIVQQGKNMLSGIPVLRQLLPQRVDVTGQPMMQNQGRVIGQRALENFLLPQTVSEEQNHPVINELMRINEATGETKQFLKSADRKITVNGEKVALSTDQYIRYQTSLGQTSVKVIEEMMNSPAYTALGDADKAVVAENAIEYADALAKEGIAPGVKVASWIREAEKSPLGVGGYILQRNFYNSLKPVKDEDGKTVESAADIYRRALLQDNSLSPGEKASIDRDMTGTKEPPDYSSGDSFLLSQLTDKQQERYEKYNRGLLTAENYYEIVVAAGHGKTKTEKIAQIEGLGYSRQQAVQIYNRILSK